MDSVQGRSIYVSGRLRAHSEEKKRNGQGRTACMGETYLNIFKYLIEYPVACSGVVDFYLEGRVQIIIVSGAIPVLRIIISSI